MALPLTYMKVQKGFKIRYIRDWTSGDSDNRSMYRWREIQAFDKSGVNLALGKPSTFSKVTDLFDQGQLNDGIAQEGNGAVLFDSNTPGTPHYAQIDLGSLHEIKEIKIWHEVWTTTYVGTKTEVSQDGVTWTVLFDSAISGVYLETPEGKTHPSPTTKIDVPIYKPTDFPTSPLRIMTSKGLGVFDLKAPVTGVRYIRDWCGGSNTNALPLWAEIMAFDQNGTNVALFKPYSFSPGMTIIDPGHVNDGIVSHVDDNAAAIWDGITPGEMYYAQIDLQSVIPLKEIIVWHYYDGRIFQKTRLEVSVDGINWTVIFDSSTGGTYPETMEGKKHTLLNSDSPLKIMTKDGVKAVNIRPVEESVLFIINPEVRYTVGSVTTVAETTDSLELSINNSLSFIRFPLNNIFPNFSYRINLGITVKALGRLGAVQFHIYNETTKQRFIPNVMPNETTASGTLNVKTTTFSMGSFPQGNLFSLEISCSPTATFVINKKQLSMEDVIKGG